jgi:6-phosphofructokinase 1
VKLKDIGPFLCEQIKSYFKAEGIPVVIRYFDPSYQVRSRPANSEDALLCDLFARHAVHAAMAGKTGVVIGFLHERFIHVPIELLATHTKRLDPPVAGGARFWPRPDSRSGSPETATTKIHDHAHRNRIRT